MQEKVDSVKQTYSPYKQFLFGKLINYKVHPSKKCPKSVENILVFPRRKKNFSENCHSFMAIFLLVLLLLPSVGDLFSGNAKQKRFWQTNGSTIKTAAIVAKITRN